MSPVAPAPQLPPPEPGPGAGDVFRFVSVGRVPRWKGVHLGLQAFAKSFGPTSANADKKDVEYTIIGDGSDLSRLKQLAKDLGVADRVKFEGDLPYTQCLEHLATAGAVLHASLRDSAGLVFEALSLGVPVACCDIGTPSLLVDQTCGAVIPSAGGPDDVVARLAEVMLHWRHDVDHYRSLRRGAEARSHLMSRQARSDTLETIYDEIIAEETVIDASGFAAPGSVPNVPSTEPVKRINGQMPLAKSAFLPAGTDRSRL